MASIAKRYLTRDEIRELTELSDADGWRMVGKTVGTLTAVFAATAAVPWLAPLSVVLLGGQQHALAILVHESAHRTLFRNRRLNDWAGRVFGSFVWLHMDDYRRHHLKHHRLTGTEDDPDGSLRAPYPATRTALARRAARDLLGISGLKRFLALALMDLRVVAFTVAATSERLPPEPLATRLPYTVPRLGGVLAAQLALFALLASLGVAWLYGLWAIAWLTVYGLLVRWRAAAEHAATEHSGDMLRNTRSVAANALERLTLAPHAVGLHLEHHLLMTVPAPKLQRLHDLLVARGALDDSPVAAGYVAVLREITVEP
jgi:fatty acid desaturase